MEDPSFFRLICIQCETIISSALTDFLYRLYTFMVCVYVNMSLSCFWQLTQETYYYYR